MIFKLNPEFCLKIAAIDSHNSIAIEKKKISTKFDFCIKTF